MFYLKKDADPTECFLRVTLYHENSSLGNDIECGKGTFFLCDSDLDMYFPVEKQWTIKPEGTLLVRLRKVGEIEDTPWYMEHARLVLRTTIEDMIRTFVHLIVSRIENDVKKIVSQHSETKIMGIVTKQAKALDPVTVGQGAIETLHFVDMMLAMFNKHIDRRYDTYLYRLYPDLFQEPDQPEPRINTNKIPIIIHILWEEILNFAAATLNQIRNTIHDHNVRRAQVLSIMVEYVKSVFYCEIGKKARGLTLAQLESPTYILVREGLDDFQAASSKV